MYTIYYLPTVPKVGMTKRWPKRLEENIKHYRKKGIEIDPKTARVLITTEDQQYGAELEVYFQDWYGCRELGKTDYATALRNNNLAKKPEALQKIRQAHLGRSSSKYGTGKLYKELSTGFVGYRLDHIERFKMPSNAYMLKTIKKNAPISRGKYKGMQWAVID